MKTNKVYRVQNCDGGGCYTDSDFSDELNEMTAKHDEDTENHPAPGNDGETKWDFECLHGFESLESLCKWFSDTELQLLEGHGFYVCELRNVRIIEYLQHQVLFKRTKKTGIKILEVVK